MIDASLRIPRRGHAATARPIAGSSKTRTTLEWLDNTPFFRFETPRVGLIFSILCTVIVYNLQKHYSSTPSASLGSTGHVLVHEISLYLY